MDSFHHNQANLPYFLGYYRQLGSGFGATALGIGRVALPLARVFVKPAAKKIGKVLLLQTAPELIEVATKRKSPKQALKRTVHYQTFGLNEIIVYRNDLHIAGTPMSTTNNKRIYYKTLTVLLIMINFILWLLISLLLRRLHTILIILN